jgi:hypothetical protein
MLLAAWYYSSERLGLKQIQTDRLGDDAYREELKRYLNLGERIVGLLRRSRSGQDIELADTIEVLVDGYRARMRKRVT